MLDPDQKERLTRNFRVHKLIWLAMLSSLVIYLVVGYFLAMSGALQGNNDMPLEMMTFGFLIVSMVCYFAARWFRHNMLTRPIVEADGSQTDTVATRYMTALIISLALSETIGVFGLVMVILGAPLTTLFMFIILSAFALVVNRPQWPELETFARQNLNPND